MTPTYEKLVEAMARAMLVESLFNPDGLEKAAPIARAALAVAMKAAIEVAEAERKDWAANGSPREAFGAAKTRDALRALAPPEKDT